MKKSLPYQYKPAPPQVISRSRLKKQNKTKKFNLILLANSSQSNFKSLFLKKTLSLLLQNLTLETYLMHLSLS